MATKHKSTIFNSPQTKHAPPASLRKELKVAEYAKGNSNSKGYGGGASASAIRSEAMSTSRAKP